MVPSRARALAGLATLIAVEFAGLVLLVRVGEATGPIRWTDATSWLATTPSALVVAALARSAGLLLATWLLGSTLLAVVANFPRLGSMRPLVRRVTHPLVRRLVEAAMATVLTLSVPSLPAGAAGPSPIAATAVMLAPTPAPAAVAVAIADRSAVLATPTIANPRAEPETCVVTKGDSLWRLAQRRLGSGGRYTELWQANKGRVMPDGKRFTDPDRIYPGWVLALPDQPAPAPAGAQPSPPPDARPAPAEVGPVDGGARTANAAPANSESVEPTTGDSALGPPVPTESEPTTATTIGTDAPSTPASAQQPPASSIPESPEAPPTSIERTQPPRDLASRGQASPARWTAAALVGGTSLIAAVILAGTARLRRRRLRTRRAQAPLPPTTTGDAERRVRAIADDETMTWVDVALRLYGTGWPEGSAAEIPAIRAVRPGSFGLELLLDHPLPEGHAHFQAADDGWVLRLDPDLDLEQARAATAASAPAAQAVVEVGLTPDGPLLVDLEQAGRLTMSHPAAGSHIQTLALQLATAPWAHNVEVVTLGLDMPSDLRTTAITALHEAREAIGMARFQTGSAIGDGARSAVAARSDPALHDLYPPCALLIGRELTCDERSLLDTLAPPGAFGVAVVAPNDLGSEWRLIPLTEHEARLEPLGVDLRLPSPEDVTLAEEALAAPPDGHPPPTLLVTPNPDAAAEPPLPDPPPEDHLEPIAAVEPSATAELQEGVELEVQVLGPLVLAGCDISPHGPRMEVQVLVRLAFENGPLALDILGEDLFPGGAVSDNTIASAIKRSRKRFGFDRHGIALVGPVRHGRLHPGSSLSCDLHRFRRLVDAGDLRTALELIRGEPFSDLPAGYEWADNALVYRLQCEVVAAADNLAADLIESGQLRDAVWAANQGLSGAPEHEGLRLQRARAEAALGDLDALRVTIAEIETVAADLDAQPLPETRSALDQLLQETTARGRRAS
jgi:hypothetical protein